MGQGAVSVNRYRSQRNWGLAFSSTTRGTRAVFLENELLRVGVLAGNGTDVFEFNDKPHDMDFVWLTAGGMRNPASYLSTSPDLLRQPRLQGVGAGDLSFQPGGSGWLWYEEPVTIAEDGSAGPREEVARLPVALPDGLAFDAAGNLHIACYEPSQMLRVTPDGTVVCLIRGEEAHLLCHPTNLAFRDNVQFTTNLGR
jgi:hypothetical protein